LKRELKLANASHKIGVVSSFSDGLFFVAHLANASPNGGAPHAIYAPFKAAVFAANIGVFKLFNKLSGFSFVHCPCSKLLVLAKEELGKERPRWDQFQKHTLHGLIPMLAAIVLEKGIAKSFV
jgi:hypothetical protein